MNYEIREGGIKLLLAAKYPQKMYSYKAKRHDNIHSRIKLFTVEVVFI